MNEPLKMTDTRLEAELSTALAPGAPKRDLIEKLSLDYEIAVALGVSVPEGLTGRVFGATRGGLRSRASVLARIAPLARWAIAACLLLAAALTLRLVTETASPHQAGSLDLQMGYWVDDAMTPGPDLGDWDVHTAALALEIDAMVLAVEDEAFWGMMEDRIDVIAEELLWMEAEYDVF